MTTETKGSMSANRDKTMTRKEAHNYIQITFMDGTFLRYANIRAVEFHDRIPFEEKDIAGDPAFREAIMLQAVDTSDNPAIPAGTWFIRSDETGERQPNINKAIREKEIHDHGND